jgi:hypothetical protein
MSFTGKATYSAGATLPEIAEDVADLVSIASPHETPLLNALGDPAHAAKSTIHEWLEDSLVPNTDTLGTVTNSTTVEVSAIDRFRVGDLIRAEGSGEVILVTAINTSTSVLTLQRSYGGSPTTPLVEGSTLHILGNAALEGGDAGTPRFTTRSRKTNYTQIFTGTIEVSGSELACKQIGVKDELDYQKNQRLRELVRDLENSVINGFAPSSNPQGSSTVRRSMRGIVSFLQTNVFVPGESAFPADTALTEAQLNLALRTIWQSSAGNVDLIVVGGVEKRSINQFIASNRRFTTLTDTYRDQVSVYESDFGVCRVILSRYIPTGSVLLLDSSRINVMPLAGRSFHYKPLASTGDRESGQVIGEYTLELRNEAAHGVIQGLG